MMNEIEILAPVGSMESLYAAIANGARAVYLGGKLFNARQYASNFENEELREAVKYAHIRNVRVYVTLNILMDDTELEEAIDYILFLYNIDVDAVIVQDLGLARIIKKLLPDFEIHGSTQMTINNYMGVRFLEDLDFQRVVLARELSVDDIRFIKDKTNLELEGFIHGALCVSYSGQCLMSSIIGGRSGNRGRCAQPCRMTYSIVRLEDGSVVNKELESKYLLSPKDLNTIDYLEKVIDSGITSLKIEGRMKRPEYAATIVSKYKRVLDSLYNMNNNEPITNSDRRDIAQIFNRGFTKGHLMNTYGKEFISYDRPDNRGVYIGRIIRVDREHMHMLLEDTLNKGDGIEIINDNGEKIGVTVGNIQHDKKIIDSANPGMRIKLNRVRGVEAGSLVNKTSDVELLSRAKSTYEDESKVEKIDIYMDMKISQGKPLVLNIWDNKNHVTVQSEELVEEGKNTFLTEEKVRSQMEKLGGTPYKVGNIDITLEDNSMISISIINKLRRAGIDKLNDERSNLNHRIEVQRSKLANKIEEVFDFPGNQNSGDQRKRKISVKVSNVNQFEKLDLNKLDRIYLNYTDGIEDSLKELSKYKKEVYLSTGKIISNKDFKDIFKTIDKINISDITGINASNMGTVKFIKDKIKTKIHCDIGLNVFNSSTIKLLEDYGVESVTLSPELKLSQISSMCKNTNLQVEALGYGYLPLMVSKYCPLSLLKGCNSKENCLDCNIKEGYGLKDRMGMIFPMESNQNITTIYNSKPLVVLESLIEIYNSGLDFIRLDYSIEKDDISLIQDAYYDYANDKIEYVEAKRFVDEYKSKVGITKGHYFRGVI